MRGNHLFLLQEINKEGVPGRFIDVNEDACLELGYSREKLLEMSPGDIVSPGNRPLFSSILESLRKQKNLVIETELIANDGRRLPVALCSFLIRLEVDRAILYLSTYDDSFGLAKDQLREGEEKYRLLVENMDEGVVISQKDRFLFFNGRFAEILGYEPEELEKKDFNDIYTPRGIEILRQRHKSREKGENLPPRYETLFRKKDGTEIDVEANVATIDYKGESATFAVIRDISSRKQVEDELWRAHDIYRKAIENAQGVPYRFNYSEENYEFIGEGCEALLGVPPHELKVGDFWDIVKETIITDPGAPRDPLKYIKAFQKGERKCYKTDIRIVTKKGDEKWLSDFAVPILDEKSGKVVGSMGILQDITERKKAEEELKRIHKIYRIAIENAQGVPYFLNYHTDMYEFFGDGSRELLGVPPNELTHKRNIKNLIQEVIMTDPAAQIDKQEYIQAILRGEHKEYRADLKIVTPQGEEKWLSDSTISVIDEKTGEVIGALGILQDISDRKKTEEKLRMVHQIYREAIENAQGIPYRLNYPEGTYEFIGEGCDELLGIPAENMSLDKLKSIIKENVITDPKAPSDFNEYIQAFMKGEIKKYRADLRIVTPQGKEKWLSDCSVKVVDEKTGKVVGMLGILQDITDRKLVEEKLKRVHSIYRIAIENAQGVPYSLNFNDYTYDFVGEGCEELLGISGDKLTFNTFAALDKELFVNDSIGPINPYEYGRAFRKGKIERFKVDLKLNMSDGNMKWISDCAIPLCDDKTGQVIGSLGILQDITERKQAEKVLQDYAGRLEEMVEIRTKELKEIQEQLVRKEKLALLGQLAGSVGHELRNPLSVINNALYYLKSIMNNPDEKIIEYLNLIESEVESAGKIVSDLMDFSRTKPVEKQKISVLEIVRTVLDRIPPPENIQVSVNAPPNLPPLCLDPGQISQVIANLLTNAYQAMPDGGNADVLASLNQEELSLTIKDTGCGISDDNMKKIFEPLFTTKRGGIGLGLSITKNLVEANGGKIEIQSKEGQGSAFTLVFPVCG
ncbi:PAS domain S-box protein [Candidatus Sumerlaeota bacterium]|nr:PAS domain S-box protein [Candidatus Sumerlaeota bacterium]